MGRRGSQKQRVQRQAERERELEIKRRAELSESQEQEIETLRSIYPDEFTVVDDEGTYEFPHVYRIRLDPHSDGTSVVATLKVEIPRDYPAVVPKITIENPRGLDSSQLQQLKRELDEIVSIERGDVCVFQLASHAMGYLSSYRPKSNQQSLHEEMIIRQSHEKQKNEQIELDKKRCEEAEQKSKLDERVKEEMARKLQRVQKNPRKDGIAGIATASDDTEEKRAVLSDFEQAAKKVTAPRSPFFRSADSSSSSSDDSDSQDDDESEDDIEDFSFPNPFQEKLQNYLERRDKSRDKESGSSSSARGGISKEANGSRNASKQTAISAPSSRYLENFIELGLLGKGGFGDVVKAKNKLDGLVYAIKKIKISTDASMRRKILREVVTVARLHHQYIVRYYQAWIEGSVTNESTGNSPSGSTEDANDWLESSQRLTVDAFDLAGGSNFSPKLQGLSHIQDPIIRQMLYIQMEFCPNRTLRDVIDEGVSHKPETVWRLFRQILEAVEYMHSKNVIHRDLKPPNLFIDEHGNIKVGDFGLSQTSLADSIEKTSSIADLVSFEAQIGRVNSAASFSGAVGTPFYRAPEVEACEHGKPVAVDSLSDMYALGIILFELWVPFTTLMERHEVLLELVRTGRIGGKLRSSLDEKVVRIVEWLLQREPENRPSSRQLLSSGLIPMKDEEKLLNAALAALSTRENEGFRPRLVDMLFSLEPDRAVDLTYDLLSGSRSRVHAGSEELMVHEALMRHKAIEQAEHVFSCHGAIPFDPPLLMPKNFSMKEPNSCVFLDPTGTLVQLPFSLTVPFARYVAHHNITSLRRYNFGKIYRLNVSGGQPLAFHVCEFDIVFPKLGRAGRALYHAEVLKVVDQLISMTKRRSGISVYVNHLAILNAVLEILLPLQSYPQQRRSVDDCLSQLGRSSWRSMERTLVQQGIRADVLASLGSFVSLQGPLLATLPRLESNLNYHGLLDGTSSTSTTTIAALENLRMLGFYLDMMRLEYPVELNAGMACNMQLFRGGIVFQVVQDHGNGKQPESLAIGGRYDALISDFRPPETESFDVGAVGASIALDKLAEIDHAELERLVVERLSTSALHSSNPVVATSVLLFCSNGRLLDERVKVAAMLWGDGVRAEYIHPEVTNSKWMKRHCAKLGFDWLVEFKAKWIAAGLVRVTSVSGGGKPIDVEYNNLSSWIMDRANDRNALNGAQSTPFEASAATPASQNLVQVAVVHDPTTTLKLQLRNQAIKIAKTQAAPLVSGLAPAAYEIVVVFLPLVAVRQLLTAYHEGGGAAMQKCILHAVSVPKPQLRVLANHILDVIHKRGIDLRYIIVYSAENKKIDLLCL